ncbi:hypothetical protein [Nocardiopsis eucommiae]|uniref:hypothetical protein n=1 Tax=Nocardiopsis eucommiae TaxID=2831970 RepID=UPI003D757098
MTSHQLSPGVRSVLAAPRGHRFPRPARPQRTVPSRVVPATSPRAKSPQSEWARTGLPWSESHQDRQERLLRQMQGNPRVAYMLEHGPLPHWVHVARQQRERKAREAATTRAEPERVLLRGRHRAPRRWWGWPATAISSTLLLGLTTLEILGQPLSHNIGIPA